VVLICTEQSWWIFLVKSFDLHRAIHNEFFFV
jgi:hypothetical protein